MSASTTDIPLRVQRPRLSPGDRTHSTDDTDASLRSSSLDSFDINTEDDPTHMALERRLGLWSGMAIVMGSIIGSGIFSTPALILESVGSVGMSLVVWVVGALVSLCGCAAYMELGTMLPQSGGEKAYLDAAFPRPRALLAFVFCACAIFVASPSGLAADGVVAGSYLLYAATGQAQGHAAWAERLIGVLVTVLCGVIHAVCARAAIRVQTVLTVVKALLLVLVVAVGALSALSAPNAGAAAAATPSDLFAGSARNANAYAGALFKLRDPARTLPRAALGGLALTALLYILSNVAYFAVLDADAVRSAGTTVAGVFFTRTLGPLWGQRVVPVLIALATLGNVMCGTFAASRLVFAAAREGYVPMGHLWGAVSMRFQTPVWALGASTVLTCVYIVAPPPGQAYALLIDVGGYSTWVFSGLAVLGLLRLRWTRRKLPRPFRVWMLAVAVSLAAAAFMCVAPFVSPPPASETEAEPAATLPYWAAPLASAAFIVLACGLWYVQYIKQGG
ncbi:amino acid/polyamine transporter I [Kickxella alabastrina]|uniref:amino acid/polyamine transporter I n=1 Tax=Kickxella alabastrina TaxID=61397 RepID=UPI00221F5E09|nr:amino acid/polyamine transporter I [Kickxella alabastrina]KAI7833606.1 amino acid/polyamine transporter I [Kickxella alabastrina]